MSSKFFNVNKPTQIVTITEDKDTFYELSDGSMIKKDTFMQKYQPVLDDVNESVKTSTPTSTKSGYDLSDPDAFFNSTKIPENVVSGIKQADPTKIRDVNDQNRTEVRHKLPGEVDRKATTNDIYNESLVKRVDENNVTIPNNTNTDVSQYKVYDNDEEAFADFQRKQQSGQQQPQKPQPSDIERKKAEIEDLFLDEKMALGEEEAIQRRSKRLLRLPTAEQQVDESSRTSELNAEYREPTSQPTVSPIELMFSTFKRKHPITINVKFEDKIGEPDFVKLMVENMDGDIVGYYKKKVMENIMKDLSLIEKAVEETIKFEIFGEEESDEEEQLMKNFEKNKEGIKNLVKRTIESKEPTLILGGTTKTGKQKYKYVDENGKVKELLPESAKVKGYEPYTKG